jgi:hypothetical protein
MNIFSITITREALTSSIGLLEKLAKFIFRSASQKFAAERAISFPLLLINIPQLCPFTHTIFVKVLIRNIYAGLIVTVSSPSP